MYVERELNETVSLAASGDEAAFGELCEKYAPLIQSMSKKYAGMVDGAEEKDLSQEAVLALYRAVCTYVPGNGQVSFGLYSKICIRNALVSELRRLKRKRSDVGSDGISDYPDGIVRDADTAGDSFVYNIDRDLLSRYELTVLDMYISGAKVREIARSLGRDTKSVSNAIFRIKTKLRGSLGGDVDNGSKPKG